MKNRTIEEIHDKEIGHSKFARFLDMAMAKGYNVTNIKEYNEKFKFQFNGYPMEFDKSPKANGKWQFEQCERLYFWSEQLKERQNNG